MNRRYSRKYVKREPGMSAFGRMASHWKRIGLLLCVLVVIGGGFAAWQAFAVYDERDTVTINPKDYPSSVLVIGTHLIHMNGMTQELYDKAQESASESNQTDVYYKSELADGTWFNITSAMTLVDITTAGVPVTDSVIAQHRFQYYTDKDGVTTDLRSGKTTCIFDMTDPYDVRNLAEMNSLKLQYETLDEQDKDMAGHLNDFLNTNLHTNASTEYDRSLEALHSFYIHLADGDGTQAQKDKLQEVKATVDAARRYEALSTLDNALNSWMNWVSGLDPDEDPDDDELLISDQSTMLSAAGDCLKEIETSLNANAAKMMSRGVNLETTVYYELSQSMIASAKSKDFAAATETLNKLVNLQSIMNGETPDIEGELALLEETLLPRSTDVYNADLWAGQTGEYNQALADGSAQATLDGVAATYASETDSDRSELQFFITAKQIRMENQPAFDFISERLEQTYGYYDNVPTDAFYSYMDTSIQAHIDFLSDLLRQLELALGGNDNDKLMEEKSDLQEQLMACLDNGDLDGAKDLQGQIEDIDSMLESGLDDMIDDLLDDIAGGDGDAANKLVSLMDLDPLKVFPAVQDAYKDASGDMKEALGAAILDNTDAYKAALDGNKDEGALIDAIADGLGLGNGLGDGLGDGTGDGLGDGGGLDLAGLLNSLGVDGAGALLALQMYYDETDSNVALDLIGSISNSEYSKGRKYIYLSLGDSRDIYAPLPAITHYYTGMRYVWDRNKTTGTLAKGSLYYVFTVYSKDVSVGREGKMEQMLSAAKYNNTNVYIPAEYSYDTFKVDAVYLSKTQFGLAYDDDVYETALEIFEKLMQ